MKKMTAKDVAKLGAEHGRLDANEVLNELGRAPTGRNDEWSEAAAGASTHALHGVPETLRDTYYEAYEASAQETVTAFSAEVGGAR